MVFLVQRVRMAHALQRISFATCDPDNKIFAYMTNNPSPLGLSVHAHVFLTRMTKQVTSSSTILTNYFLSLENTIIIWY